VDPADLECGPQGDPRSSRRQLMASRAERLVLLTRNGDPRSPACDWSPTRPSPSGAAARLRFRTTLANSILTRWRKWFRRSHPSSPRLPLSRTSVQGQMQPCRRIPSTLTSSSPCRCVHSFNLSLSYRTTSRGVSNPSLGLQKPQGRSSNCSEWYLSSQMV
jgi:hypothetical protein